MNTAQQLRKMAIETLKKRDIMEQIETAINIEAEKGRGYLKTAFPLKHIKELKEECEKNGIKFTNQGNGGSSSLMTTIYLDWSLKGDGMILISDLDK